MGTFKDNVLPLEKKAAADGSAYGFTTAFAGLYLLSNLLWIKIEQEKSFLNLNVKFWPFIYEMRIAIFYKFFYSFLSFLK